MFQFTTKDQMSGIVLRLAGLHLGIVDISVHFRKWSIAPVAHSTQWSHFTSYFYFFCLVGDF